MPVTFPEIHIKEPMQCGALVVFPLFADGTSHLSYLLSEEAMARGTMAVREVSEAGSVPELLVDNGGESMVLFLEGEELRGAKQNRVLNASILVGAKSRTTIPVTCVERGRWGYSSRQFSTGSHCPPILKQLLKEGVWNSASRSSEHSTDQTAVWTAVRRKHRALGVTSRTSNLSDALETHRDKVEDLRTKLPCPEGALGIAVALGGKIVSVDMFDQPGTLAKVWDRIMQGLVLDMLEIPETDRQASGTDAVTSTSSMKTLPVV